MAASSSLLARAANAISDKSSLPIRAAAAVTVAVGTLFGAHIASGQEKATTPLAVTLDDVQCRVARAVTLGIQGRHVLSAPLNESFKEFARTCNLRTVFNTVPNTGDDRAFGELMTLITAIRMTPSAQLAAQLAEGRFPTLNR